jgi:hypothetical protein
MITPEIREEIINYAAYHEAGHVAGMQVAENGMAAEAVCSITEDGRSFTAFVRRYGRFTPDESLLYLAAGAAAADRFAPMGEAAAAHFETMTADASQPRVPDDGEQMLELKPEIPGLAGAGEAERVEMLVEQLERIETFLAEHEGRIRRIAAALVELGRLNGQEIDQLWNGAEPPALAGMSAAIRPPVCRLSPPAGGLF